MPESVRLLIATGLGVVGFVLVIGGALGVLRFADVFTRAHALRAMAWGAPFVLAAIAVEAWRIDVALRLALVAAAIAVTGAALTHLIVHVAHRAGVAPDARR